MNYLHVFCIFFQFVQITLDTLHVPGYRLLRWLYKGVFMNKEAVGAVSETFAGDSDKLEVIMQRIPVKSSTIQKMKKISLKDVRYALKRDEMRAIQGGGSGCKTGCDTVSKLCWNEVSPGVCTVVGYCGGYYCP